MGGTPPPGFQTGLRCRLERELDDHRLLVGRSPAPRSTRGWRGIRMPDARAKRRRRRRQEQLEAADLEMVSGFAVETHMVAGASIGSVAALVLAYMLWPENSYIFTPQVMGMTLGGGALGAFIMGCRKILSATWRLEPLPMAHARCEGPGCRGSPAAQCWSSRWPWQPSFSPIDPCRS